MEPKSRSPRRSLTKTQLQEPVALDLLALLQTITADGKLLEPEVELIKQWLEENKSSTLPAVEYLRESVQAVLEDGRVTPEECTWLQKAVETVLPKEERDLAALRRRRAVADDRREATAERERQAEVKRLSRPIATFDVMVAGVLYEGRAAVVKRFVVEQALVYLVREPTNQYSPNAMLVRLDNGMDIGYVPETEAVRLAPLLDQGALHAATVKKVLQGSRAPIPVIWGELYSSEAVVADAVAQGQVPQRQLSIPLQPAPIAASTPEPSAPLPNPQSARPPGRIAVPTPPKRRPMRWLPIALALVALAVVIAWIATRL